MRKKTFRVDIDNTLCRTEGGDFPGAVPISENIEKINALYDAGHTIIIWTARGYVTGLDWRGLTEAQLEKWGVKYHELYLDKPFCDLLIDDRSCGIEALQVEIVKTKEAPGA